jgi:hypothetical protein
VFQADDHVDVVVAVDARRNVEPLDHGICRVGSLLEDAGGAHRETAKGKEGQFSQTKETSPLPEWPTCNAMPEKNKKRDHRGGFHIDFRRHKLVERQAQAQQCRIQKPNCVPVLVEVDRRLDTCKPSGRYQVPGDATAAQFLWIIRRDSKIPSHVGLFAFFGYKKQEHVPPHTTMKQVYSEHRDKEDNLLYCKVLAEELFG